MGVIVPNSVAAYFGLKYILQNSTTIVGTMGKAGAMPPLLFFGTLYSAGYRAALASGLSSYCRPIYRDGSDTPDSKTGVTRPRYRSSTGPFLAQDDALDQAHRRAVPIRSLRAYSSTARAYVEATGSVLVRCGKSQPPTRLSPEGFEPSTSGSGGQRSIQLSYGD